MLMTDADTRHRKVVFNHPAVCPLQRCEKTDVQQLKKVCRVCREAKEDNIMINTELAELYFDV